MNYNITIKIKVKKQRIKAIRHWCHKHVFVPMIKVKYRLRYHTFPKISEVVRLFIFYMYCILYDVTNKFRKKIVISRPLNNDEFVARVENIKNDLLKKSGVWPIMSDSDYFDGYMENEFM